MLAVLIDPDKSSDNQLDMLFSNPNIEKIDFVFVGGSLVTDGRKHEFVLKEYKKQNK